MRLTNFDLVTLIKSGLLVVDLETTKVVFLDLEIIPQIVYKTDTEHIYKHSWYRIELEMKGAKRNIMRSRLVYMAGTGANLSQSYEIWHLDMNPLNDTFSNLIAIHRDDHDKFRGWLKDKGLLPDDNRSNSTLPSL